MADYRVLAEGLGFTEGPVWTQDGRLLVTSIWRGVIYEVSDGEGHVVFETGGGPNGLTEGAGALLYVTQNGGDNMPEAPTRPAAPGVQIIEGSQVRHLADSLRAPSAPNDLCFGPDGRLYFTDPRGWAAPQDVQPGRVYALTLENNSVELLAEGPKFTNGIAFGPDTSQLFVAETFGSRVLVYPVNNGKLGVPREFCHLEGGMSDGMCFDENGLVYVAAPMGHDIQVFDRDGRLTERLACGDDSMPTNCCFGGPEGRTLFVTDSRGERVLAFDLDVAGLPLYPFR